MFRFRLTNQKSQRSRSTRCSRNNLMCHYIQNTRLHLSRYNRRCRFRQKSQTIQKCQKILNDLKFRYNR